MAEANNSNKVYTLDNTDFDNYPVKLKEHLTRLWKIHGYYIKHHGSAAMHSGAGKSFATFQNWEGDGKQETGITKWSRPHARKGYLAYKYFSLNGPEKFMQKYSGLKTHGGKRKTKRKRRRKKTKTYRRKTHRRKRKSRRRR